MKEKRYTHYKSYRNQNDNKKLLWITLANKFNDLDQMNFF